MPDDGHRRPKDNSKEPEEDKDQRDRVLDDFHESVSGSQEDRCRSDTDEQRKFGTNEGAKIPHAFSITVRGHERDHIHCPGVMQSAMDDRGTYSSIFAASPMVLWWSRRAGMKQPKHNRRRRWQRTDSSPLQLSFVRLRRTGANSLRILLTIASIRSAGTSISCNKASASAAADSASS